MQTFYANDALNNFAEASKLQRCKRIVRWIFRYSPSARLLNTSLFVISARRFAFDFVLAGAFCCPASLKLSWSQRVQWFLDGTRLPSGDSIRSLFLFVCVMLKHRADLGF
jgi:hypothetical protein